MDGEIVFYTHGDSLELNGTLLSVGELTADMLNLTPDEYAVNLLSVAAADIPDSQLLYHSDDATRTVHSRNGILEQIGRMIEQDHFSEAD